MYSLNSGSGQSNRGRGGSLSGKSFLIWLHPLRQWLQRSFWRKHKRTLFPKLIMQLGLPIFLPLMGLCIRPKSVGLQACFAQGVCLWVSLNYHHNSKNCTYLLPTWLKSWVVVSNFCLPNYLRLQSSGVNTESRVMCIPQNEEVPAPGIKWDGEEVRLNSSNLLVWTKTIKRLHTFSGLINVPILITEM